MRVLVADDSAVSRRLLETVLTSLGYEPVPVASGTDALRALQAADAPPLAVLDRVMPGLDGDQVCRAVRSASGRYVYLLLMTGTTDKSALIDGLEAGADDYLTKPFDPHELRARLIVGRRILAAQDQLIAAREAMRDLALRDALTGLWNHRAVTDRLTEEVKRAGRDGRTVGVVLADLDQFKRINDTHGHLAGDAALREAARRMTAAMRPYDVVGRYGGEEFLIVAPGCDRDCANAIADRVRRELAAAPIAFEGKTIPVTASFGVAVAQPGTDAHTALAAADAALYRAKAAGRDRVSVSPTEG